MKRFLKETSVFDERELLEMYRIEHAGLWAVLVLLCAAVVVQLLIGLPIGHVAGELAALIAVSVGMLIAYARKGLWDAHSRPSTGGNALYSAACAAGVALLAAAFRGSVWWGLAAGAAMFALCFALLSVTMAALKRRQSREAAALEDEIDS